MYFGNGMQDLKADEITVTLRSGESNQWHNSLLVNCRLKLSVMEASGFKQVDWRFLCTLGGCPLMFQSWVHINKLLMNLCCAESRNMKLKGNE